MKFHFAIGLYTKKKLLITWKFNTAKENVDFLLRFSFFIAIW